MEDMENSWVSLGYYHIFHFTDHSDVHVIQDDELLVCYISAHTVGSVVGTAHKSEQ